jgi:hypothetical protein
MPSLRRNKKQKALSDQGFFFVATQARAGLSQPRRQYRRQLRYPYAKSFVQKRRMPMITCIYFVIRQLFTMVADDSDAAF